MTTFQSVETRFLLNLRALLADDTGPQQRLDNITRWVARTMSAEVCSIYLQARDNAFELCATEGLDLGAVHKTRLNPGEGLVGHIALSKRPYQTSEAAHDPHFSPKPETKEAKHKSFFGIPLIRAGKLLGVITIQNDYPRVYTNKDEEQLQIIAMVLSEFLAAENFNMRITRTRADLKPNTLTFKGQVAAEGLALGQALIKRPAFAVDTLVAASTDSEQKKLDVSFNKLMSSIERLIERSQKFNDHKATDILKSHKIMANDPEWRGNIVKWLNKGLTAESAVEKVLENLKARFRQIDNVILKQRIHDIEDLSARLVRILRGEEWAMTTSDIPENPVLVTETLGPAELLDYSDFNLLGLIVEASAASSHTAIIARALDIPMISGIKDFSRKVDHAQTLILDGETGTVYLNPSVNMVNLFKSRLRKTQKANQRRESLKSLPCITRDGITIDLSITAGLRFELGALEQTGASGIGLFRTELDFLITDHFPKRKAQENLYRTVIEHAKGRPVIFRTLDIGGDKVLPYLKNNNEDNPALGLRAIRLSLKQPALLRVQIQALLRASSGQNLHLMFPMIACTSEFIQARELCEKERKKLASRQIPIANQVHYGAMIEVPALLYDLDKLLPEVDFVSVGSNDFHQYFWAADRGNHNVSQLFDTLGIPFLSALKTIVCACEKHQVPLGLCGEMASDPIEALALIGLGFKTLSIVPKRFHHIKETVRRVKFMETTSIIHEALAGKIDHNGLRTKLAALTE